MPVARDAGRAVCRKRLWRRMEAERERAEGTRQPGVSGPGALLAAGRCSQRAVRGGGRCSRSPPALPRLWPAFCGYLKTFVSVTACPSPLCVSPCATGAQDGPAGSPGRLLW